MLEVVLNNDAFGKKDRNCEKTCRYSTCYNRKKK